ncbi:uncharacterized protein LOC125035917 [Penaeus chinensis]|uniref:uncharacterized protein LOC125035917 n=1 Tax=Penaeus chinensis TaxID=139456 RepID=UPI001FB6E420|nr:uncharacterized protein LOC125035917 [Penaeus chinensis]
MCIFEHSLSGNFLTRAYPVYTVGDTTMYTAATTYYQPGSTTPVSYSQEVTNSPVSGQILATGGNTYVIQQGIDTETHSLLNTRASPQTMKMVHKIGQLEEHKFAKNWAVHVFLLLLWWSSHGSGNADLSAGFWSSITCALCNCIGNEGSPQSNECGHGSGPGKDWAVLVLLLIFSWSSSEGSGNADLGFGFYSLSTRALWNRAGNEGSPQSNERGHGCGPGGKFVGFPTAFHQVSGSIDQAAGLKTESGYGEATAWKVIASSSCTPHNDKAKLLGLSGVGFRGIHNAPLGITGQLRSAVFSDKPRAPWSQGLCRKCGNIHTQVVVNSDSASEPVIKQVKCGKRGPQSTIVLEPSKRWQWWRRELPTKHSKTLSFRDLLEDSPEEPSSCSSDTDTIQPVTSTNCQAHFFNEHLKGKEYSKKNYLLGPSTDTQQNDWALFDFLAVTDKSMKKPMDINCMVSKELLDRRSQCDCIRSNNSGHFSVLERICTDSAQNSNHNSLSSTTLYRNYGKLAKATPFQCVSNLDCLKRESTTIVSSSSSQEESNISSHDTGHTSGNVTFSSIEHNFHHPSLEVTWSVPYTNPYNTSLTSLYKSEEGLETSTWSNPSQQVLSDSLVAATMVYYANMQYLAHCGTVHGVTLDGGVTYMVSGNSPALDADAQANLAHATRVSPATVQWLMDNYETAEGVSLPRSTLYNHYLRHCADHKLDPVNAASFGKLIRSVFLMTSTATHWTFSLTPDSGPSSDPEHHSSLSHHPRPISVLHTLQQQEYLGDISRAVPMFGDVDFGSTPLPAGVTRPHLHTFTVLYREHCETILEAVYNLQFPAVESLWRRFWLVNNNNNVSTAAKSSSSEMSDDDDGDLASLLPSSVLQALLRAPPVLEFVRNFDYQFYQNLVEVLIPDVLKSIPSSLTQAIRNFAKSLESWLSSAMLGCPPDIVNIKVTAVASLAQTLRRYTSLNHLAQAARAVLQNSSQITQMLADLNRVDFHNVQEQASWVCQCDSALVDRLEEDFKATLQQQNSLEQWAEWLQAVVSQVLRQHEGKPDFPKQARQFLLKWSFYSSMVIRDLTLRSAASFGSFHLIRLLYDEYMFYLVEHKVASSLGVTPIAVISQVMDGMKNTESSNFVFNGDINAHHRSDDGVLPAFKRLKYET